MNALEKIPGVDVSSILDDERIVVVVDSEIINDESSAAEQMKRISGVKGIYPAYRHFHE